MTTAAYYSQTNGLVERYNKRIIARLWQYFGTQQCEWDLFLQPLTYVYNTEVHLSTNTTPFSLVLTKDLYGRTTFESPSALAIDA